jgi:hypothetical protein
LFAGLGPGFFPESSFVHLLGFVKGRRLRRGANFKVRIVVDILCQKVSGSLWSISGYRGCACARNRQVLDSKAQRPWSGFRQLGKELSIFEFHFIPIGLAAKPPALLLLFDFFLDT